MVNKPVNLQLQVYWGNFAILYNLKQVPVFIFNRPNFLKFT